MTMVSPINASPVRFSGLDFWNWNWKRPKPFQPPYDKALREAFSGKHADFLALKFVDDVRRTEGGSGPLHTAVARAIAPHFEPIARTNATIKGLVMRGAEGKRILNGDFRKAVVGFLADPPQFEALA